MVLTIEKISHRGIRGGNSKESSVTSNVGGYISLVKIICGIDTDQEMISRVRRMLPDSGDIRIELPSDEQILSTEKPEDRRVRKSCLEGLAIVASDQEKGEELAKIVDGLLRTLSRTSELAIDKRFNLHRQTREVTFKQVGGELGVGGDLARSRINEGLRGLGYNKGGRDKIMNFLQDTVNGNNVVTHSENLAI